MCKRSALSFFSFGMLLGFAALLGLVLTPATAYGADKAKAAKPAAKAAPKPAKAEAKPAKEESKASAKTEPKAAAKGAKSAKSKKQEEAPSDRMPWALRDRYTFDNGPLLLDFAKDDGEWRIRVKPAVEGAMEQEVLVKDVGFVIELADGRTLKSDEIYKQGATMKREKYTGDVAGNGTHYTTHFGVKDGLAVSHQASSFDNWPYLVLTLTVRNDSPAPVTVNRVIIASLGAGGVMGLGPEAKERARYLQVRGGCPLFSKNELPQEMSFLDPKTGYEVSLGVIPSGLAETGIILQPSDGAWQGAIMSDYQPGHVIKPGETFEADSVLVSFGGKPVQSDTQYSWYLRSMKWPVRSANAPRAWVTVADTEGLGALVNAAKSAQGYGVTHALIPAKWESAPGYPKDIAKAAKELKNAGCTPGITVDPLAVQGEVGKTAKAADGQLWANPADDSTAAALQKRVQKLIEGGFGFVVVERTHIPDDVLTGFGISRGEAEWRAFGVVSAAAAAAGGKACVFPASETKVKPERDAWLEAAAAVGRIADFGGNVGPVTLEGKGFNAMDNDLATAMRLWQGPIEILGEPGASARAALGAVLGADPLRARPVDVLDHSPLLWQMQLEPPNAGYVGATVIAFKGAPAWNVKDAEPGETALAFAWAPDGDKVTVPKDGEVPAATAMTVTGLCPELAHPAFVGVSQGLGFGMDKLKSLAWDEKKGTLRGETGEALDSKTRGYVALTPGWKVKNVKVGSGRVKPTAMDEKWLVFPMTAGSFEIEFEKAK